MSQHTGEGRDSEMEWDRLLGKAYILSVGGAKRSGATGLLDFTVLFSMSQSGHMLRRYAVTCRSVSKLRRDGPPSVESSSNEYIL